MDTREVSDALLRVVDRAMHERLTKLLQKMMYKNNARDLFNDPVDLGDEKARFTSPKLRPEEAHAAPPPVFGSGADAKGSADGFAPDWRAASMRSQERIQNYVCVSVDLL